MKTVLAFDFGASSGRAIKAEFDGSRVMPCEIHRFDNIPVMVDGHLCHNVPMLLKEVKTAVQKAGRVDSLAFDTWGVDYALLNPKGELLHLPFHYRDGRTAKIMDIALDKISMAELYQETGNQIMKINTLFQLLCDENLPNADSLLFMPDLFAYLLSGNKVCEQSIASTSQMLNPVTKQWSSKVLNQFGIREGMFPKLVQGEIVNGEYGAVKIVTVAGHDTQCAVAAMPGNEENAAFLSCGTWSLIGCELDAPILTEESRRLELSNELGANGKINFLKNISGLWLIQEVRRNLAEAGAKYSYNEMEMLARSSTPYRCFIDPDDEMLSQPGGLPGKIREYCQKTGQAVPETAGEVIRCIYESLALKYRYALEQISHCTGRKFTVLHLLGGGAKDSFLCGLTADSLGIPVAAGPIEATALGNISMQLLALGEIADFKEGKEVIAKTEEIRMYEPSHTAGWQEAYGRFEALIAEKNKEQGNQK